MMCLFNSSPLSLWMALSAASADLTVCTCRPGALFLGLVILHDAAEAGKGVEKGQDVHGLVQVFKDCFPRVGTSRSGPSETT